MTQLPFYYALSGFICYIIYLIIFYRYFIFLLYTFLCVCFFCKNISIFENVFWMFTRYKDVDPFMILSQRYNNPDHKDTIN